MGFRSYEEISEELAAFYRLWENRFSIEILVWSNAFLTELAGNIDSKKSWVWGSSKSYFTKNDLHQVPNNSFVELLMLNELPKSGDASATGLISEHVSETFRKCSEKTNASEEAGDHNVGWGTSWFGFSGLILKWFDWFRDKEYKVRLLQFSLTQNF